MDHQSLLGVEDQDDRLEETARVIEPEQEPTTGVVLVVERRSVDPG